MFTRLTPILPVTDVRDELTFYECLGFEQYVDPVEVYSIEEFAAVTSSNGILFGLAKHEDVSDVPPTGLVWQFETSDIDQLSQVASSAGVDISVPVKLQPWGRKTMTIISPSGYVITFEEG